MNVFVRSFGEWEARLRKKKYHKAGKEVSRLGIEYNLNPLPASRIILSKFILPTEACKLLQSILRILYPVICTFKQVTVAAFLVDFGKICHQLGNFCKVSFGEFLAHASYRPKKKIPP